ncbi:MAG: tetratricopeptide repeat protein, partial [Myxococcota bacterium]|nr:tetratricopeptide repeat protein [Myxococcota bacterium]
MADRKRRSARRGKEAAASSSPSSSGRYGLSDALAALSLIAVVVLAYANALDAGFVYDDVGSIVENHHVQWEFLSVDGARAAWLESPTHRLVANWSFGFNYFVSGLEPRSFHAVNLVIHALAVLGVYALILTLARRSNPVIDEGAARAVAWVAAAIFAAHPIQTQAVTYVVQRMASLGGLFCLVSLLCYASARSAQGGKRIAAFVASATAWLLAVGSKESAAAFPLVLWAYEWAFVPGANRRVLLRMAGWVALAAATGLALMRFNYPDPFRDYMYHDFTVAERLLTQGRVFWEYVGLILWPHPSRLVLMHDFAPSRGLFDPVTTAIGWLALLGIIGIGAANARRQPWVAFGLVWIAAALVVESSVFPLRLVHEHRLYLPMVGFVVLLAAGLVPLARRSPVIVVLAALPLVGLLGLATQVRNEVWLDRESLWSDVVAKNPGHAGAQQNLGAAYMDAGRIDEALAQFERGREVDPGFGGNYRAIGVVHVARGELEEAIPLFERAAVLDPLDYFAFMQWGASLHQTGRSEEALLPLREAIRIFDHPKSQNYLGKALAALGRNQEALVHHQRALALDPHYEHAHVALAHSLSRLGRIAEARRHFEAAFGSDAEAEARTELASLDWSGGNPVGAQVQLRRALELAPNSEVAANNLAWMLASVAEPSDVDVMEAERWWQRAADARAAASEEPDAGLLDTWAVVLAASGRMEDAAEVAERAGRL